MASTIPVHLGTRSYDIVIQTGRLLARLPKHPLFRDATTRILIVSDTRLHQTARSLARKLGTRRTHLTFLKGGEPTKNLSSLPRLYTTAIKARLDRKSIVIAIGGGVIGDCAGFFAATYLRGIRIVHVPTTLIAQVDSAIGGKTGVNLPEGKNLIGSFHQPSLVFIDPEFLGTLSQREFRAGLAEVIKYGVIADPELFHRLEARMKQILARNPSDLAWIIQRSCKIKANVVSRDEYETSGLRAILNFGHTLGHGIEAAAQYRTLHGEAIALGMIAAARLSAQITHLPDNATRRIIHLIREADLPTQLPRGLKTTAILDAMKLDKKAEAGKARFVLANRIGAVRTGIPVSDIQIRRSILQLATFSQ